MLNVEALKFRFLFSLQLGEVVAGAGHHPSCLVVVLDGIIETDANYVLQVAKVTATYER